MSLNHSLFQYLKSKVSTDTDLMDTEDNSAGSKVVDNLLMYSTE